jgi:hypothetical protein
LEIIKDEKENSIAQAELGNINIKEEKHAKTNGSKNEKVY